MEFSEATIKPDEVFDTHRATPPIRSNLVFEGDTGIKGGGRNPSDARSADTSGMENSSAPEIGVGELCSYLCLIVDCGGRLLDCLPVRLSQRIRLAVILDC